jgi:2-deoxy-D-gluconate 3-dehydrogenase
MKPTNELLDLNGKVAIITGGAKGIGYGIAARLAGAGAKVVIADLDGAAAHEAAQKLGDNARAVAIDVSNEDDVKRMVAFCEENFNGLDILVNNAGIFPNQPVAEMSLEGFEKVIHVNLRSVMMATKYASEMMKRRTNGGKIINITSIDAIHPSMVGFAHYDASKHGVWGFTMNSALELAPHKIWVNAIAPGGVTTPGVTAMQGNNASSEQIDAFMSKIPMHRMGEPDEIGKVALFLASDMASYMTGSHIIVDGGALLA